MEATRYFLLPGELCVSREPAQLDTLLGSCVAVCLFNRKLGFGGMNHYMLPCPPAGTVASGKHGDYSLRLLIEKMKQFDENLTHLEAHILGGANVTGHLQMGQGIGGRNIIVAVETLEQTRIRVVEQHIGGQYGRKVYFRNWTGEVEVRRIERSDLVRRIEDKKAQIASRRIKVLVVDDSPTIRLILTQALSLDPQIEVVGGAADPYEARQILLETDPDVICLDIIMPRLDGVTFLKKLFLYAPKPVIVVSTIVQQGSKVRDQVLRIGAVDVVDKEELNLYQGIEQVHRILSAKVKAAAAVYVQKKTREELERI